MNNKSWESTRLELHEKLCKMLGTRNVYFQPPPSVKLHYPAIVYSLSNIRHNRADNISYLHSNVYSVIVVDQDPDSCIASKLSKMDYCSFDRFYASDGLNHFVFTLYF